MKIIVTGGAGFIGSAVIRNALSRGYSVLNIDNLSYAANLMNLSEVDENNRYSFINANICDFEKMDHAFSTFCPDAVIHLAAETHVDRSIKNPRAFLESNIVGTFTLLEAMRNYWEKANRPSNLIFHHVSTDEVFGSLSKNTTKKFTEFSRYDPRSPYSASKASSDHLVRSWHSTFGIPTLITNCSNNYGPFQFPEKLIPLAITKAVSLNSIPIYGDGLNVRDWLHVEDHAEAILDVLQKGRIGQTYLIGGANECTNIELIETICAVLDKLRPRKDGLYSELIEFVEDRPGHDLRYAINSKKLHKEISWKAKISLEAGIESTVKWYLDNESWWKPLLLQKNSNVTKSSY